MNTLTKGLQLTSWTFPRTFYSTIVMRMKPPPGLTQGNQFHSLGNVTKNAKDIFLKPLTPVVSLSNGMKHKGAVRRRCEHCFFVWRQGKLHNICKEKPRHNQVAISPKEKDTWILTFSSCKPRRDW